MENKLITEVVDNVNGTGCSIRNIENSTNVVAEHDMYEIPKEYDLSEDKEDAKTQR